MTTYTLAHIESRKDRYTSTVAYLLGWTGLSEGDTLHYEVTDLMGDDQVDALRVGLRKQGLRLLSTDEGCKVVTIER